MDAAPGHPMDAFSWKRSGLSFLILAAAVGLRVGLALKWDVHPVSPRETLYMRLAEEWRSGFSYALDGHPTAVVMPVYPVSLGIIRWVFPDSWKPILLLQSIAGGLAAWLVFRLAWRISRIEAVAWGTFLLCAFYPPLVLMCLKFEPSAFYGFHLALGLWLLSFVLRDSPHLVFFMAAAALFMGTIYLTPIILPLIPLFALWAGLKAYDRVTGILGAVALCLACVLSLMPWMGRNFLVMGGFIPLTTGSAHVLKSSLEEAGAKTSTETSTAIGQDESLQYRTAAASARHQISELGARGWGRIAARGFPFWVTYYPGLLPGAVVKGEEIEPHPLERSMVYKAVLLTTTLSFLVLAVAGLGAAFFHASAWMLVLLLLVSTATGILFASPSYDHLPYWPFFAIFVAWGFWTLYSLFLGWKEDNHFEPIAKEEAWRTVDPAIRPLEPIKARRILDAGNEGDPDKEKKPLGPIF
jgi:hypothetical protein